MDTEVYAPWDHAPKYLSYKQVQSPLTFIDDFYSLAKINYHRKFLKKWRNAVVDDHYYKGSVYGPGRLLFMFEYNVKLLEAAYLLMLNHQSNWHNKEITEDELAVGMKEWEYFPTNLSDKQLHNPYLVIKKLFKKLPLQEYRDHLREWLSAGLYNNPVDSGFYEAGDLVIIYENMLKLYSATWIIYQIEIYTPWQKKWEEENGASDVVEHALIVTEKDQATTVPDLLPQIAIKPFGPMLTPAEKLGLDEVVNLIAKEIPAVKTIFYLGLHPEPYTFYLLVLVDNSDKTPEHDVSSKIEEVCRPLVSVFVLVHKVRNAIKGISTGRRFWNLLMDKGIMTYHTPEIVLPPAVGVSPEMLVNRAVANWQKWGQQGQGFLITAKRNLQEGNYILGIFHLHQAVESTMIGIINVLIGYRQSIHNLSRMLRLSLLFTDELLNVFDLDTESGKEVFDLLQKAYAEARYKENYNPDKLLVDLALEKVELLLKKANGLYHQVIRS